MDSTWEPRCDLFLSDHLDRGHRTCTDADHAKALEARRSQARAWHPLIRGRDAGGNRDFVHGKPVHCGTTLFLQAREIRADDYGSFGFRTNEAIAVRYETERRDGFDVAVLYHEHGGYLFRIAADDGMRFRWERA